MGVIIMDGTGKGVLISIMCVKNILWGVRGNRCFRILCSVSVQESQCWDLKLGWTGQGR